MKTIANKTHYVVYPNGKKSELMEKSIAKQYASIFGGVVVDAREKKHTMIDKLIKRIFQL